MYIDPYWLISRMDTRLYHVPGTRFELVTRGFSVLCSTNWAIPTIPPSGASSTHFNRELGSMSIKRTKSITKSYLGTAISLVFKKKDFVSKFILVLVRVMIFYWLWITHTYITIREIPSGAFSLFEIENKKNKEHNHLQTVNKKRITS